MGLQVEQFLCRTDNFGIIARDEASGLVIAVDAPEAAAIEGRLAALGWPLTHILVTHKHPDHVDGISALKARHGCTVIGPAAEEAAIPGIDRLVAGGDVLVIGGQSIDVIATPGHTLGHVAYHFAEARRLFAADCLFSLGCGRLFEGTPAQMWDSLSRLAALPDDTLLHGGHDYTLANARFALSVDPGNAALSARAAEAERQKTEGRMSLPVRLGAEKAENPFLRPHDPAIRAALGMADASDAEVFAELRARKDRF